MATKEYFPGIGKIKFEGKDSKNPMAFRYYDAEKMINGRSQHLSYPIYRIDNFMSMSPRQIFSHESALKKTPRKNSLIFSVFLESFIHKKYVFDFPYIVLATTLITFAALNCKSAFVILYPSISFPVLTASTISSTFFWHPGICMSFPA